MADRAPRPDARRLRALLAFAVPFAAFVIVPALFLDRTAVQQSLPVRGALAGALAGLIAGGGTPRLRPLTASALAVAASAAGLPLLLWYAPFDAVSWAAALLLAALAAMLFTEVTARTSQRAMGLVVLGGLCVALLWQTGALPGIYEPWSSGVRDFVRVEPADGTYRGDAWIYLKTYWLMERGTPYYTAFARAYEHDGRFGFAPRQRFNFREPLLFEVWRALPGPPGLALWYGYVAISLLALLAAYAVTSAFVEPAAALLGVTTLVGYGAFHADFFQLTFQELWAAPVALVALALLVRRKWLSAALVLTAAVAVRELMLYLLPVYVLAWWLLADRRRDVPALLVAVVAPLAVLGVHWSIAPVSPAVAGVAPQGLSAWLNGGVGTLLAALRFSDGRIPFGDALAVLAVPAALLGAALVPTRRLAAVLAATVLLPVAVLFALSPGPGGQYWGGIAMPLVYALAPLALVRLMPAEELQVGASLASADLKAA